MKTIIEYIQFAVAAVGGAVGYFLGGLDGIIITLAVFMLFDYITGVVNAACNHTVSSATGFKGIFKKIIILVLVGVCHLLDVHIIGNGSALRSMAGVFYIANEGISILENAAALGVPIPEKLRNILIQLREEKKNEKME